MKYTSQHRSRLSWIILDSVVMIRRSFIHIFKNPDQLLGLAIQPIMFMLLFRYVFGGAINTGGTTYVNFLVAGILIQSVAFGSLTTSLSVATDLTRGIIDRFKTLPMFSGAVLVGHVTADLFRNLISATIMIVVGLLVGFRPAAGPVEWLQIYALILLFSFAFSWIGAIMGLIARSVEAVNWIGFLVVFPLTFASAAFVPTESMPWGLRLFAENQPVTQVIEALRSLMVGTPMNNHALFAIMWCCGIVIIAVPCAAYLFRTRISK